MQRYNNFLKPQYFSRKKCMKLTFFDVSQQIVCEHKHLLTLTKCLLTQRAFPGYLASIPENAPYISPYIIRWKPPLYIIRCNHTEYHLEK